jgi:hypothetical protein
MPPTRRLTGATGADGDGLRFRGMSPLTPPPGTPSSEPYLPAEEVAERLGVPLAVLMRRVEAGDVPSRRDETEAGPRWSLRLSDLGVETDLSLPGGSVELPGRPVAASVDAPAAGGGTPGPPGAAPVQPDIALLDFPGGPRQDLAQMSLDPRELVAGLLDRWERTLEQRVYVEQRQRFENELLARQHLVKELQMELQTARAEHAAAQAEKDRVLAGKERELADRERDLAESRRIAEEAAREMAPPASRRRRWFWSRDD